MLRPCCSGTQGSALAPLVCTPDSNVLDAFWRRTAAILATLPDQAGDLEVDDEADGQGTQSASSAAAQALEAVQRDAIAGPGRLVALQVCVGNCIQGMKWPTHVASAVSLLEHLHCTFLTYSHNLVSPKTKAGHAISGWVD